MLNVSQELPYLLQSPYFNYFIEFIIFIITIYLLYKIKIKNENTENTETVKNIKNEDKTKHMDLKNLTILKKFLDEIIKDNFDYYMLSKILPIYSTGKKLEKKEVKELMEEFNIDVSILFNKNLKNEYLNYFNKDGITRYINHKFLYYLNKLDKVFYKPNEKDDSTLYRQ